MKRTIRIAASLATLGLAFSSSALRAGPFILAGTDADEHGGLNAGLNDNGWLFMQRALENLAPGVTNSNKKVVFLGSSTGLALTAANSAFNLSSLVGAGWSSVQVDGAANVTAFLNGSAAFNVNNAGIIMMDSGANVSGGADLAERNAFTANAAAINSFLGAGGGLFSQANGFGWVSALVPGLTIVNEAATGLQLTPTGSSAFPGLTNADLSAGPWHNSFTNYGTLPVLAVSSALGATNGHAVILGASGGSVTAPTVPDSGSFALVYLGLAGMGFAFRRKFVVGA